MKIVIADDYPLILEGLERFLKDSGFETILTASTGTDALALINIEKPDIAILDMEMPHLDGLQIAKICKQNKAPTRIAFLTYRLDSFLFIQCVEAGVMGYILKDEPLTEVLKCIHHLIEGKSYFSQKILNVPDDASQEHKNFMLLTPSEQKILRLIGQGLASHEIADQMFVSQRTIEKHRSNIIAKLQLDSPKQKLSEWVIFNRQLLD